MESDETMKNKKTMIMKCAMIIIGAIMLAFTARLVQAQIDFGGNDPIMIEFHGDYEEVLACLNSKEWDIAEEWTVQDLATLLSCVDGMWQFTDGEPDVIDDSDEIDEEFDDWDNDSEEGVYLRIGFMGMIPFEDLNWDAFRDGDASDLVFVQIIEYNWEGMFHFQSSEPEIAQILRWLYEHRDSFTSEEPVLFEFPDEMTDEEFNRLIDEEGAIWMPREIRIGTKVDACPYDQEHAPWTEGIGYYCETIFYMDDELFERLYDFAWTLR